LDGLEFVFHCEVKNTAGYSFMSAIANPRLPLCVSVKYFSQSVNAWERYDNNSADYSLQDLDACRCQHGTRWTFAYRPRRDG